MPSYSLVEDGGLRAWCIPFVSPRPDHFGMYLLHLVTDNTEPPGILTRACRVDDRVFALCQRWDGERHVGKDGILLKNEEGLPCAGLLAMVGIANFTKSHVERPSLERWSLDIRQPLQGTCLSRIAHCAMLPMVRAVKLAHTHRVTVLSRSRP